ncbi:MAG: hypothetical protein ACOX7I_00605 [Oscillospiraceae bacterium]
MGAFSLLLRWMQNLAVFDKETGLATPGASLSYIVAILLAVTALAYLAFVRGLKKYKASGELESALKGRTVFFPLGYIAFGFLMVAGAAWMFIASGHSEYPVLFRILALLTAASGVAVPVLLNGVKSRLDTGTKCLCSVVPVAQFCFWLIVSYKEHAANPTVWAYAIEILAISAAILGFYFLCGYAFGRAKPFSAIYFCGLGGYMCFVALADNPTMGRQLIFLATAVLLLLTTAVLVENLEEEE